MPDLERAGVVLQAVSVDSAPDLAALRTRVGVTFELLSDEGREATRAFGVYDPGNDIAWPALFLLDEEGRVTWSHVEATYPERLPVADIVKRLTQPGTR